LFLNIADISGKTHPRVVCGSLTYFRVPCLGGILKNEVLNGFRVTPITALNILREATIVSRSNVAVDSAEKSSVRSSDTYVRRWSKKQHQDGRRIGGEDL
jgi:hypothetical protein